MKEKVKAVGTKAKNLFNGRNSKNKPVKDEFKKDIKKSK